jgi:hypothetical protein
MAIDLETKIMTRLGCSTALVVLLFVAAGCGGGGPVTPTRPSQSFSATGIVTDDQGAPVGGATVTIRHWLGGMISAPSVETDASGRYTIGFTADTAGTTGMQAEIFDLAYERYLRSIMPTSSSLVENFRLHRVNRVTAGDSIVLSVTPDNGDCQGWLNGPCGRVRVAVPADGNLRIEAVPTQAGAALPQLEVCCVAGNERYGNPVTISVTAGTEQSVEVGQASSGVTTSESVIVKTSLESF